VIQVFLITCLQKQIKLVVIILKKENGRVDCCGGSDCASNCGCDTKRELYCTNCDSVFLIKDVEFGSNKCTYCGNTLSEHINVDGV
jgi:hypothetical protein